MIKSPSESRQTKASHMALPDEQFGARITSDAAARAWCQAKAHSCPAATKSSTIKVAKLQVWETRSQSCLSNSRTRHTL